MQTLSKQTKQRLYLLIAGVSALIIAGVYTTAQQATRQAANNIPISTAQTVSHELAAGMTAGSAVPSVKTNLASDSTVFVIITDSFDHILASSADLAGQTPLPPAGVFSYTTDHGSDKFTWQPANGVRLATWVTAYGSPAKGGFIVTGQSLSQAEKQVSIYGEIALATWIGVLAWSFAMIWLPLTPEAKPKPKPKTKRNKR